MPLSKEDLNQINKIVIKAVNTSLISFWDKVLEPAFNGIYTRLDEHDKRFDEVDKRFELVDKRFDEVDKRFELVDKRFDEVDKRFDDVDLRFDSVDRKLTAEIKYRDELEVRVKKLEKVNR